MHHVDRVIVRTRKLKGKAMLISAAFVLAGGGLALPLAIFGSVSADHVAQPVNLQYTPEPFTASYLSTWTPDRTTPSGGYASVNFAGRQNVLQMNIDTSKQSPIQFYQTEGIQHALPGSGAMTADLYVDSSWLGSPSTPVSAGFWGVGNDQNGVVSAYPIIEFTTRGAHNFTGWRLWNDIAGKWTNLVNVPYHVNSWNNLAMVYDPANTLFNLYVNGQAVGSNVSRGSVKLGAVIFDNYNYGSMGSNYSVYWSDFAYSTGATQCKEGGWKMFGNPLMFRNQGQCVSYFEHNAYVNTDKQQNQKHNQDSNKHQDK